MAKSITVKIGADTKDFLDGLKSIDREIKTTQKTANDLTKSLEYDYDETRAVQAMQQFQKAIELCEQKAEELRAKLKEMESAGRIDTTDYAKLQLELAKVTSQGAKATEQLEKLKNIKIEQLNQKLDKVGATVEKVGQKVSVLSAGAAGIIAGATAIGKSAAATGAEIDDMTQQFDVSAETIQRWNYLALQAGVDSTAFTRALIRARAAMADLSTGTSNAATQALDALGISARQFGSDEEMFDGILKALSEVEDSTLQTAYANEIFGDRIATQLLPYINAGAEDLAKWNAEFEAMPSLTGEEASALAELDDTFNRLNTTMQYATAQLGEALAPIIERVVVFIEESLVPAIEGLANWFENLSPGMQDTILAILGIIAVAGPLLILIGKIVPGIKVLISLIQKLNSVAGRATVGISTLGAVIGLTFGLIANWEKMGTLEHVIAIIGILTAAVLGAAVAFGAFHSAWSLGLAVTGIVAGITAAVAAINSVKDEIEVPDNLPDYDADEVANGVMNGNYSLPEYTSSGSGSSYTDNTYADQYNVTVNVTSPGATAEEIAAAVGREIATLAQSRR
nr:MAG TPA: tail tape measure [Caudoviricetes sp.]